MCKLPDINLKSICCLINKADILIKDNNEQNRLMPNGALEIGVALWKMK